jgi:hypothetical protein
MLQGTASVQKGGRHVLITSFNPVTAPSFLSVPSPRSEPFEGRLPSGAEFVE